MRLFLFITALCGFLTFELRSQEAMFLNEAMKITATDLTRQLNHRGVKQVGVADFTYQGRNNTRIGKQIADELSVRLTMSGGNFKMTSRDIVRRELVTTGKRNTTQLSPKTTGAIGEAMKNDGETKEKKQEDQIDLGVAIFENVSTMLKSNKVLKGTDAIVFGKIEDRGDFLDIVIEVTENNKKGANIGGAIVYVIQTKELEELTEGQIEPIIIETDSRISPVQTINENTPKFKHQTIQFEVVGCNQFGRDVECKLNLFSEVDLDYYAYFEGTRFISANGGKTYYPAEIKLAEVSSTSNRIGKSLVQNTPIAAVFRFSNVSETIVTMAKLEIRSWASGRDFFSAFFYNVPVD